MGQRLAREGTPEGRIGKLIGSFTRKTIAELGRPPEDAELEEYIRPHLGIEILEPVLLALELHCGAWKEALDVVAKIDKCKREIALRRQVVSDPPGFP